MKKGKVIYSSAHGHCNSLVFFSSKKAWEAYKKEHREIRGDFQYLNEIELVEILDVFIEERRKVGFNSFEHTYSEANRLSSVIKSLDEQIKVKIDGGFFRLASNDDDDSLWRYVIWRDGVRVWNSEWITKNKSNK